ncbi:MAG TPA: DUF1592 domain-containing protein [Planctomycetota bacterium]|nr:DUF1592 domain-containing protein [Planctomycetota bacterium]
MTHSKLFFAALLLALSILAPAADDATNLQRSFHETVQPFLKTFCADCHATAKPKGDFDLKPFSSVEAIANDFKQWETVLEKIQSDEMPPAKAKLHPKPEQRREITVWIQALRAHESTVHAGDPGPVYARRLNTAEYNYTIRDLTGVDIQPANAFPVDPANLAGFDNSSESLSMSPELLNKYLEAARFVADHLVLNPHGLAFAPHAVITDTDRDKYCVNRILAFYKKQRTDYADFFFAAWKYQNRAALGKSNATLNDFAAEAGISAKYLTTIWEALTVANEQRGALAALQILWREVRPAIEVDPFGGKVLVAHAPVAARTQCEAMRDFVVKLRAQLIPDVKNMSVKNIDSGAQAFVLWKDRQLAANRLRYGGNALKVKSTGLPDGSLAAKALALSQWAGFIGPLTPEQEDARAAAGTQGEKECSRFCAIFPDAFYVAERGRVYLNPEKEKDNAAYRPLSAGFHSMMGYFRDDGPLCALILDDASRKELDELWDELDFVASAPIRQYTGQLWSERTDSRYLRDAQFDFARPEDKDCIADAKMIKLAELYYNKAQELGASEQALAAIKEHFDTIRARIRWIERTRQEAEPSQLEALKDLAQRAFRRPLSQSERADIDSFYRTLRDKDGLDHEDAIRDSLVSILVSPQFCYLKSGTELPLRSEKSGTELPLRSEDGTKPRAEPSRSSVLPLSDFALASRLSYFLWSSLPDKELLDRAAAGRLHQPEILVAQARRMLQDDRARALAVEFGGNWLDFRRFEELNSVDRTRFPSFDNELRAAMFEEPIHFLLDTIRNNRSVLDMLYGDYTFVNATLATAYGIPKELVERSSRSVQSSDSAAESNGAGAPFYKIDNAAKYGRGGLLPMAVFLTKNAPGLRTSPVKRGYWIVRRLLGERIPPPPPNVPVLPADEAKLGDMTLRDALAKHREDKNCAACHARFDSLGLVFENYGPIGERREKDLAGHVVDTRATFPDGSEGAGLEGLRSYIRQKRQDDFLNHLCRELLAYGLGRSLILSDDATINDMRAKLAASNYRFDVLIESIVTSPQFHNKRVSAE